MVRLSSPELGDRSTGVVSAPRPTVTEDGERPLSSNRALPGDTEAHRIGFGVSFGGPFTCVMDSPIPDDTEVGDRPSSIELDRPGDYADKTESYRNRMIPWMQSDHSHPNLTGRERPRPTSCTHRHRTIPQLETNRSRPIPTAR